MSTHPLTIVLSARETVGTEEGWWVRLSQAVDDAVGVGVDQAAAIVDDMFRVEPCEQSTTGGNEAEQAPGGGLKTRYTEMFSWANPPTEEDRQAVAADMVRDVSSRLGWNICNPDGSYTAEVEVHRSHPSAPVRIVVEGGMVTQHIIKQMDVQTSMAINDTTSVQLDYGVLSGFSASFSGLGDQEILVLGSTVNFSRRVTGALSVEYITQYEVLSVSVPGDGQGSPVPCRVLCFFQGMAEEIELEPPEVEELSDEDRMKFCPETGGTRFDMSLDQEEEEEEAEDEYPEPTCDRDETSAAEFQEICCGKGVGGPPPCKKSTGPYFGGRQIDGGAEKYIALYGSRTEIRGLMPADGYCGKLTTMFEVQGTCCDEVDPLTAHPDNPTEIASGQRVLIRALGGKSPYYWRCSSGLEFDNWQIEITTATPAVYVRVLQGACENSQVDVTDDCSLLHIPLHKEVAPLELEKISEYATGHINFSVTGGVPPIQVVSSGQHTHFMNNEREITISGQGTITLYIEQEQYCDGEFSVTAADSCGDSDEYQVKMAEGENGGLVCIRYESFTIALADWVICSVPSPSCESLCGQEFSPALLSVPRMVAYSGLSYSQTVTSGVCSLQPGKYFLNLGYAPYFVVIGDAYPLGGGVIVHDLEYYSLDDYEVISDICPERCQ